MALSRTVNDILFRMFADTKGLEKGSKRASKSLGGVGQAMGGLTKAAGVLGAAMGARELVQQFNQAVDASSDFNESVNALEVTTGDAAEEILELGKTAATGLGLSKTAVNEAAVAFSAFGKQIDSSDLGGTFEDYATRATDFASVMNLEVNDALRIFQSGLAGESEPLRKFGIDMSAASVSAFAYANGIADVGDKLTETEKIQARYAFLMEQTDQLQGDFANTSGELAGQQKILAAEMENLRIEIGDELLPAMLSATQAGLGFIDFVQGMPLQLGRFDRALDNTINVLTFGLAGNLSAAEDQMQFFANTVQTATNKVKAGRRPIQVYGEWVNAMAKESFISSEMLDLMSDSLNLTDDEVRTSISSLIGLADELDLNQYQVQVLTDKLRSLRPALAGSDDAMIGYATAVSVADQAMIDAAESAVAVTRGLNNFGDVNLNDAILAHFKELNGVLLSIEERIAASRAGNLPGGGGGGGGGAGPKPFHQGGTIQPGGVGLVGERGPEIISPRGGAHITPSHRSGGGGGGVTVNVEFSGVVGDPTAVAEQIQDLLEQYTRTNVSF